VIVNVSDDYGLGDYKTFDRTKFESKFYPALRASLDEFTVDRSSYALNSPDAVGNGNYCIHFDEPFWVVYIAERGKRLNPAFFSGARDAADFLLWKLIGSGNKYPNFPIFKFDPYTWT
jgi:hypothetical protein